MRATNVAVNARALVRLALAVATIAGPGLQAMDNAAAARRRACLVLEDLEIDALLNRSGG